jgi:tripartite-type tricarboxylate transporter receptor subunit TctC
VCSSDLPAQTPAAVLARLEQEAIAAARSPTAIARLKALSANAVGSTSAELAASIAQDLALYQRVTRAAGLQKQN